MKPSSPLFRALRRLALTTKQVNKGFYKGNRTGSMGRHTRHGGYIIDPRKVRTYVVPERLADCKLTPFVTRALKSPRATKFSPIGYLNRWKVENGTD